MAGSFESPVQESSFTAATTLTRRNLVAVLNLYGIFSNTFFG